MRLHPPKLTINNEDPFKDALFGRQAFADSLTGVLRSMEDGLVLFVNAR